MFAAQRIEVDVFILLADDSDHGQHGNGLSLLVSDEPQDAFLGRLDIEVRLVRFYLEEGGAPLDGVTFLFEPGDDLALGHALAGFGHQDWVSHGFVPLCFVYTPQAEIIYEEKTAG